MTPKIDSHQHFWTYTPENYNWITDAIKPIQRDFGPEDLKPLLKETGVDGTVIVEARGHISESDNILAIADTTDFVKGVVGYLPMLEQGLDKLLEKYSQNPKFKGLRHAIQSESDPEFSNRLDFNASVSLLKKYELTFDLSLISHQVGEVIGFVDRHPDQTFIVDHFGKPLIRDQILEPWTTEIRELAKRPNVYCKVSGLTTEADTSNWTYADLQPYLEVALEAFSPQRLMFGSDWPVSTLGTPYANWFDTISKWISKLSESEQERILGGTAIEAYRL